MVINVPFYFASSSLWEKDHIKLKYFQVTIDINEFLFKRKVISTYVSDKLRIKLLSKRVSFN